MLTLASVGHAQEPLIRTLALTGAMIETVADVPTILARMHQHPAPDLVVLDWECPGMAGTEVMQRMRECGARPAVLFLPVCPGPTDENDPLRRGADDLAEMQNALRHLVKSMELLIANAAARSADGSAPAAPEPGAENGLELHRELCRVTWKGRRVPLSLAEFRIISRLVASPGFDISHRDIYDIIRGEGFVSGRGDSGYRGNVRAAIKRIRQKFLRIDPEFRAIRSYHGFGYRWDEAEPSEVAGDSPG
ncbi:MAG: response regulator transcription factor [Rhodospirillales bacterium]|nr:response regulator transcription factor [Rhodospirillales bacterium]